MLLRMQHRGPDSQRSYQSEHRLFQCGFDRLSIIDVASGHQPLISADGQFVLLGNGEIYNYLELRRRPECRTYPFRTDGDMEVLLPLAAANGPDFIHDCNGMFALALYDSFRHRLLLVRDRLGIKPLYWAHCPQGGILFASEPKALFASGLITPKVLDRSVSSYLAHGYIPAPDTLYAGVWKVPPGHMLEIFSDGAVRSTRYWQPRDVDLPQDEPELRGHVLALMEDAVKLQMQSDVPVGALLSGGLDSGMIVALGATMRSEPLNTYTVSFDGAPVDEGPIAAEVAQRFGTRHTNFRLPVASIMDQFPRLVWHSDDLVSDASLLPNFLIEQALSQEVRVALNGTGGDELFVGYGRYFPHRAEQRYLRLPAWARKRMIEPALGAWDDYLAWKLRRAEKFEFDPAGYVHEHSTLFPPPVRKLIGNRMPAVDYAQHTWAITARDRQTAMLSADLGTYLADDLLTLLDRTSMACSVEGRVPLLDHRLVETMLCVPDRARTPDGQQKGLLRRIASDLLPESVLRARKQGFASPVEAWLEGPMLEASKTALLSQSALDRGWWTRDGVDWLFQDKRRHAHRIYALLVLYLTITIHVDRNMATAPDGSFLDYVET